MMAEAYGKLTGRPGICFVTRGPGATNASAGVHIAHQDSTPMILFIGQVGRGALDREAFQEVDFRLMFAPLCKWVAQIERADRIPEYLSRAFHVATSGRPGPVVLALPEDVLAEQVAVRDAGTLHAPARPQAPVEAVAASPTAVAGRATAAGGGGRRRLERPGVGGSAALRRGPPAAGGGLVPLPGLPGQPPPALRRRSGPGTEPRAGRTGEGRGLPLLAGARMGEASSRNYTLLDSPTPRQTLVHVYPDTRGAGSGLPSRSWRSPPAPRRSSPPRRRLPDAPGRRRRLAGSAGPTRRAPPTSSWIAPIQSPGPVQLSQIVASLRTLLPEDAIVTNGAGNYTVWLHRFYQYRRFRTQLGPTSGSMGYGLPAAVSASLLYPRAPGGLLRRRRLLPDARPGAGHRRPVRRPTDRHRGEQRQPGHHPGPPGTPLPRPGQRHRPGTIPTSWRWRGPTAPTARASPAPRSSPGRSPAPRLRDGRH